MQLNLLLLLYLLVCEKEKGQLSWLFCVIGNLSCVVYR